MTVNQQMMELKLRPVLSYMRKIVSNLQKKDPANILTLSRSCRNRFQMDSCSFSVSNSSSLN